MAKSRRSPFDADDLVQRYVGGETMASLSKRFRTDRTTIHVVLSEHGVQPRDPVEARLSARRRIVDGDDLAARYVVGESVHALSKRFGVDQYVVRRVLREHDVPLRDRADAFSLVVHALDEDAIAARYMAGESVKELLRAFRTSDGRVQRILRERNIPVRGMTEANRLMAARLTDADHHARSARHATAWEVPVRLDPFTPRYPDGLRQSAITRQTTLAMQQPDELKVRALLPPGWADCEQFAVDWYNLDFTHGSVAVEVHSSPAHPFRIAANMRRTVDLAEHGWHVAYVWLTRRHPLTAVGVAEYVTHVERLDRDPSPRRQYVVVGGGGELVSAGHTDTEHRTLMPAPVYAQRLADGKDSRIAG